MSPASYRAAPPRVDCVTDSTCDSPKVQIGRGVNACFPGPRHLHRRWRIPNERGTSIRRLVAVLVTRRRFGLDVCMYEHIATGPSSFYDACESAPVHVGCIDLTDAACIPHLVYLRTPAVEPFFAASLADPVGVSSRRLYRWSSGHKVDYWDEDCEDCGDDDEVSSLDSPDELSACVSSLSEARTGRMRDVLTTIQADQDASGRGASGAPTRPMPHSVQRARSRSSWLELWDSRCRSTQ